MPCMAKVSAPDAPNTFLQPPVMVKPHGGGKALTSVSCQSELHHARHVARPCGGEDESSELMRAWYKQSPSSSRSLAAVVLGALVSKIQRAGLLPSPLQSGSQ